MLRDLVNNLKASVSLLSATRTADANGTGVDLQGYDSAMALVNVGASGDTLSASVKAELEMQHSDDNSSFSACANADISAPVTGTNLGTFAVIDASGEDSSVYKCGYKGNKRYIRVVYNITGTHTVGTPVGAVILLGSPERAPVA